MAKPMSPNQAPQYHSPFAYPPHERQGQKCKMHGGAVGLTALGGGGRRGYRPVCGWGEGSPCALPDSCGVENVTPAAHAKGRLGVPADISTLRTRGVLLLLYVSGIQRDCGASSPLQRESDGVTGNSTWMVQLGSVVPLLVEF